MDRNQLSSILSGDGDIIKFKEHIGPLPDQERVCFIEKCYGCTKPGELNMLLTKVPHFKEMVVMAFNCDHCGFRSNEVKVVGVISTVGTKITLQVQSSTDIHRDLLKSDSATVYIPEIDLEITEGSLGGRFTTIEGLLRTLRMQLSHMKGFNMSEDDFNVPKTAFGKFIQRLKDLESGEENFTFIIDDPTSNSFIQNLYAPDDDPQLRIQEYKRTREQDDDLGLVSDV
ncbi:zpr1 [Acrasis kona]|uniref:Zpr1 n=1 Tax=Acrasis kona TaxID=1008807 RepID=A0AAW2YHE9_9EUKA